METRTVTAEAHFRLVLKLIGSLDEVDMTRMAPVILRLIKTTLDFHPEEKQP